MISIKKWGQLKNRKEPSNFNIKNLGRVAQLVKCPTLDFCSDHDLMVLRSSPTLGSELGKELFWDSPSAPPLLMCNLSPCTPTHPPSPKWGKNWEGATSEQEENQECGILETKWIQHIEEEKVNQLCKIPVTGQDDHWIYQHRNYWWLWQNYRKKICLMVIGKTILFNPEWVCTTAMLLTAIALKENMLSNTMNKYLLAIYCVLSILWSTLEGAQDLWLMLHHTMET